VVVLGLPRGGVPVAREVARALDAPLDVIVVRKLGVPSNEELAVGAVGEDGVTFVDEQVRALMDVTDDEIAAAAGRERIEVERRAQVLRRVRSRVDLHGRTAVVVDDGVATGSTARAACAVARAHGAARVVLAVPVAPAGWQERMGDAADEYLCVTAPRWFGAVGQFYDDFHQTSDAEVVEALRG
jgi:putative phosphoribosyl transferase